MNKILSVFVSIVIVIGLNGFLFLTDTPKARAAGYDKSNLCSDAAFTNYNALDEGSIQDFLVKNGSFLRNYSENGRRAAKIINDAAKYHRINPITILSTIQKEEGLIFGTYARSLNQTRLDWAMGYGYTDGKIYEEYKGFTKQIDSGTWQLRNNYDHWASNGSMWTVGRTVNIDGNSIRLANRCTSSLYRYTPHIGGNYSFWYYFNKWGGENAAGTYGATFRTVAPRTLTMKPGQKVTFTFIYRNTGTATWYKNVTNSVKLGTQDPQDRISEFINTNRIELTQSQVRPGSHAVFRTTFTAPQNPGTYTEKFRPVAEYIAWFGDEMTLTINVAGAGVSGNSSVSVSSDNSSATYSAEAISTTPSSGNITMKAGGRYTATVVMKNTGSATWYRDGGNPVKLGTQDPQDENSVFLGSNRVVLNQSQVLPNRAGVFRLFLTAPSDPGIYTLKLKPVADYITWFGPELIFTITVN